MRYYPKHGEVFYFHEASAPADYPGVKILKKKLNPPTKYEFMLCCKRNVKNIFKKKL